MMPLIAAQQGNGLREAMCLLAAAFSPWVILEQIPPGPHRTLPCSMRDVMFRDFNSFLSLIFLLPFVLAPELSKLTYPKTNSEF